MLIETEDFTYQKYVLNLYYNDRNDSRYYTIKSNRQTCIESELSIFKKLGYNYSTYGSLGDPTDDDIVVNVYCIGYYVPTIYNIYGDNARWMPVIDNHTTEIRKDVNWEFHSKYEEKLKKIRSDQMWNIILNLNAYGGRNKPQKCIPIEISHIIYEFWRDL